MSTALLGLGTTFHVGGLAVGDAYFQFEEVSAISLPPGKVDSIDTSYENPPESFRTSIPGMINFGEIQVSMNFNPNNATCGFCMQELNKTFGDVFIRFCKVIFPSGVTFRFQAYLSSYQITEAAADKLTATANFTVTGAMNIV